jgi:hypothetical protein
MTRLANQSCRGTNTKCLEQRLRDRPIEIPARWKLNENDSQLVAEPRDLRDGAVDLANDQIIAVRNRFWKFDGKAKVRWRRCCPFS